MKKIGKILNKLDSKKARIIKDRISKLADKWDKEADRLADEAEMPSAATINKCADCLRRFAGIEPDENR